MLADMLPRAEATRLTEASEKCTLPLPTSVAMPKLYSAVAPRAAARRRHKYRPTSTALATAAQATPTTAATPAPWLASGAKGVARSSDALSGTSGGGVAGNLGGGLGSRLPAVTSWRRELFSVGAHGVAGGGGSRCGACGGSGGGCGSRGGGGKAGGGGGNSGVLAIEGRQPGTHPARIICPPQMSSPQLPNRCRFSEDVQKVVGKCTLDLAAAASSS